MEFLNKYPGEPHVNGFSLQSYLHFNHVLTAFFGSSPAHLTVGPEGLDPEIVDGEYVVSNFCSAPRRSRRPCQLIALRESTPYHAAQAVRPSTLSS